MRSTRTVRPLLAITLIIALLGVTSGTPSLAGPLGAITVAATGGVTPGFTADEGPRALATGPDGNIWFTEFTSVNKFDVTSGAVTQYTAGLGSDSLSSIVAGPDGALWFTEFNPPGRIGRITTAGVITEPAVFGVTPGFTSGNVQDIIVGPDGNLWFSKPFNAPAGAIGRITPAGVVTEFTPPNAGAQPRNLAVGADGNIWYTDDSDPARIMRSTPAGVITEVAVAGTTPGFSAGATASDITLGPDGNLWFTESGPAGSAVGRITTPGVVTEFPNVDLGSDLSDITSDCGALWVSSAEDEGSTSAVWRVTTAGAYTEYTDGLPAGSSPESISPGPGDDVWFTGAGDPGFIMQIGAGAGCVTTPVTVPTTPPAGASPAVAANPHFTG